MKKTDVWLFVIMLTLMATTMLAACTHGQRAPSEAEQSAFGCYVDSIDSLRLSHSLRQLLDADTSRWKADQQLRQHYREANATAVRLLWATRMGVSADADTLLCHLRRELPLAGLDTAAFFVSEIAQGLSAVHQLSFDSLQTSINELLPRLDYLLSKAYVRYCAGQRYGFTRPDRLLNHLELKAHSDNVYAQLFGCSVEAPRYAEAIAMLTTGQRTDYLKASHPECKVYEALRALIDTVQNDELRQKIAVNMERCRWQTQQPERTERQVVVNLPALQLWAVCPDSVLNMRICCGAITNKTPLLCGLISHMQVNPDWIVPQTIVKSDFLRHAGDSAYFARNRYYVIDRSTGDTLCAARVTAAEMESGQLRIGQKGGSGNSLGRIVFRFANDFGIYLHDTNNRRAFNSERRTLSHGCIRVQKPFELACFMLPEADEWMLDRLRISMDLPPATERGTDYLEQHADDERPLRLVGYQKVDSKVALHIIYYTAYPNPASGAVEFWPDLYGYDKVIGHEMALFLQKKMKKQNSL